MLIKHKVTNKKYVKQFPNKLCTSTNQYVQRKESINKIYYEKINKILHCIIFFLIMHICYVTYHNCNVEKGAINNN